MIRTVRKKLFPPFSVCLLAQFSFLQGCYTIEQGYHQARLLMQREELSKVLAEKDESPERLDKLRLVPQVLEFARERVGLETGESYTSYIRLDRPAVTYIVQAAEKRRLRRKTWWFPVVGSQPYLGYFEREDAVAFQKELIEEGYDTRMGGVTAFSLLGYFPDPLYSSMIDGRSVADVVDVIIHECVHRTLFVPGFSTFNESFASFVAQKATEVFLREHLVSAGDIAVYKEKYQAELRSSRLFKSFLKEAKGILKRFYEKAAEDPTLAEDEAFLKARDEVFQDLEQRYNQAVREVAKGTWYEHAFRAKRTNNAVVLAYSLYEAMPEPFEAALAHAGGDMPRMIRQLKECLKDPPEQEAEIWETVANCR